MVQRYGYCPEDDEMQEFKDGWWVKYSDYVALEQKNAELAEKAKEWKKEWTMEFAHSNHAEERIKELEADNALLRKRIEDQNAPPSGMEMKEGDSPL
jgi:hypothetical protein